MTTPHSTDSTGHLPKNAHVRALGLVALRPPVERPGTALARATGTAGTWRYPLPARPRA